MKPAITHGQAKRGLRELKLRIAQDRDALEKLMVAVELNEDHAEKVVATTIDLAEHACCVRCLTQVATEGEGAALLQKLLGQSLQQINDVADIPEMDCFTMYAQYSDGMAKLRAFILTLRGLEAAMTLAMMSAFHEALDPEDRVAFEEHMSGTDKSIDSLKPAADKVEEWIHDQHKQQTH